MFQKYCVCFKVHVFRDGKQLVEKKKLLATASVQEVWTCQQEVGKCKFIGRLYLCPRSLVVSTHSHKPLLDPKTHGKKRFSALKIWLKKKISENEGGVFPWRLIFTGSFSETQLSDGSTRSGCPSSCSDRVSLGSRERCQTVRDENFDKTFGAGSQKCI